MTIFSKPLPLQQLCWQIAHAAICELVSTHFVSVPVLAARAVGVAAIFQIGWLLAPCSSKACVICVDTLSSRARQEAVFVT
jgi:hypothetical protein